MSLTLHSAWRATAPYRVRIGLAIKGVTYDYAALDLIAGDQRQASYREVNPQGLVPALDLGDGTILTQSLAILEWLEETRPSPPILPRSPVDRATVRAMAGVIACDIHPLNNTRVGHKLNQLGLPQKAITDWIHGWIRDGFDALEPMVSRHGGQFAFVIPELRAVVVTTSVSDPGSERREHLDGLYDLVAETVIPAVEALP